jgi:ABC-2 type transport system ATP-binding protein
VHELCRDEGLTVLWATHLVDEIEPDDTLIVLHQGAIVARGQVSEICNGARLGETFARLTQEEASL